MLGVQDAHLHVCESLRCCPCVLLRGLALLVCLEASLVFKALSQLVLLLLLELTNTRLCVHTHTHTHACFKVLKIRPRNHRQTKCRV